MTNVKLKNISWYCVKKLAHLNTSIIILLIIATISILGTIIEQDHNISYYQTNYPLQDQTWIYFNWQIIINLGLDHIYSTWWFLSLLSLFFCSLITCTFSRQLPGLKYARNWKFMQNNKNKNNIQLNPAKGLSSIIYALNSNHYYVFHKEKSIYGYKGLSGRIAPIFVHLSIIITLTGSLFGIMSGFMAQEMIPQGEIFHIQNIIKAGISSKIPSDNIYKINNFNIKYNDDKSIKQFYTDISVLNENKQSIYQKIIYVNAPMKFHGLTFYQTDWNINALRIEINNKHIIQATLNQAKIKNTNIWIYKLPVNNDDYITFVITGLQDKILLYDSSNNLIKSMNIEETINIYNQKINIKEIMTSTGLQIKADPGITIVYSGFFILMLSIAISYLSYSQVWIYNTCNIFYINGKTNRAQLTFEEDLIKIQNQYKKSM